MHYKLYEVPIKNLAVGGGFAGRILRRGDLISFCSCDGKSNFAIQTARVISRMVTNEVCYQDCHNAILKLLGHR